jgi:hypothetical protein
MINWLDAVEWAVAALLALGAALLALRVFKWGPILSLVIGMIVFTGLFFPITTHAIRLDMPRPK